MRESFIVSANKNNGYPSFPDSVDVDSDFYQNQNMFLTDGINYPIFKNKNYPESSKITNTAFYADGKDYPELKNVNFSLISGAFADCTNLRKIVIPQSVKFIDENAFRNTSLTSAKIAPDCVYSPTSFPDNCKINFY